MTVDIEVYGDPVCPWCFIGKRRLDTARGMVSAEVRVTWRAFQLNPAMPPDGMDRMAYLSAKFGGAGRARLIYDTIRREGLESGIAFNFSAIRRTPNTLLAHRLIRHAGASGKADDVVERLFTAYFVDGRDIGDAEVLAAVAAQSGMDAAEIRGFLAGNAESDAVLTEDSAARASGIAGVPHFIVAGRYALPGAQSPEVIVRAIELAQASLPRSAAGE